MQAIKTYSKGAPFYNALIVHLQDTAQERAFSQAHNVWGETILVGPKRRRYRGGVLIRNCAQLDLTGLSGMAAPFETGAKYSFGARENSARTR
jgi:hypothetical protein